MQFKLGDEVLAPWMDDGFHYPAILVSQDSGQGHVAYLDGDAIDVPIDKLRPSALGIGMKVQVNWRGEGTYYDGSIKQRLGQAILVKYEQGDPEWATISKCRVRGEVAQTTRVDQIACVYCGAMLHETATKCSDCGAPRHP